ncbi:Ankyrin repeat protein 1 [Giardia muris]|uniref:Ankyrin repeat protein 1 n=1 Tax=Giardia muris TaxID=5742 RepID=A0A4Z1T3Y0_GIAMU|nr:Ankyrin repeat protein 1 [Giardia muris]|eukprot:TNJ27111.1 Ankyrin repeat protein 1 [Giardia muris]
MEFVAPFYSHVAPVEGRASDQVYTGTCLRTGRSVTLRIFNFATEDGATVFSDRCAALPGVVCRHILHCTLIRRIRSSVLLEFEPFACDVEHLGRFLEERHTPLTEGIIWQLTIELLLGLGYLHNTRLHGYISSCSLRPTNFVIDTDGTLKIDVFGPFLSSDTPPNTTINTTSTTAFETDLCMVGLVLRNLCGIANAAVEDIGYSEGLLSILDLLSTNSVDSTTYATALTLAMSRCTCYIQNKSLASLATVVREMMPQRAETESLTLRPPSPDSRFEQLLHDGQIITNDNVSSLLHAGIKTKRHDVVLRICEEIANRNLQVDLPCRPIDGGLGTSSENEGVYRYNTALMRAARDGDNECVRLLLADIGMQRGDGWTALMRAAKAGHPEIVRLLLAECRMQRIDGTTALMYAVAGNHFDCAQMLVRERMMQDYSGNTALMTAARRGYSQYVALLNDEIGMVNNRGQTALMYAVEADAVACVKELLEEAGMRIPHNGQTALLLAVQRGRTECLELLLDKEGDLRLHDGRGALEVAHCALKAALSDTDIENVEECIRLINAHMSK